MTNIQTENFTKGLTPRKIVASMKRGHNRGATVRELSKRTGSPLSTTRRRISELMQAGFVSHDRVRNCSVTGKEVYTYRLSN
jgi:predicted transcriptional regulator